MPPLQQHTPIHPAVLEPAQSQYTINAGVVLSRPPLITPDPHPLETAYHLYQRRLNERLVLPFTQYFYYKRGSPAFEDWRKRKTERGGVAARDIGTYNAYTKESWNDEVLTGDESGSPRRILEQLVDEEGRTTEFTPEGGDSKTSGLRRETESDKKNDQRSLERNLSRTLYLLVRRGEVSAKKEDWVFPTGLLQNKEGLKEAAKRVLDETCGASMNTWFVGGHPVGHMVKNSKKTQVKTETLPSDPEGDKTEKTFFMKARIFAGQANVQQETKAYEDFKWLSKEEIQQKVHPQYWARIEDMLVAQ